MKAVELPSNMKRVCVSVKYFEDEYKSRIMKPIAMHK